MEDLPPPVKITSDIPKSAEPVFPAPSGFFKKAFKFIVKIKWGKVSAYIVGFVGVVSIVYNLPAFRNLVEQNFPNSSPVFRREVSMQGILKSSDSGLYTLVLPDQQAYNLRFKPSASLANIKKLNEVVVKGRLGWKSFVIEEAEIYPLNFTTAQEVQAPAQNPLTLTTPLKNEEAAGAVPDLYTGLQWEANQKKVLIFTSGKRKIEQEGIYLESVLVSSFPQDFINYYIEGLKTAGFKETLNSVSPDGITVTYAKDDLFLTFGIKNIYKGSGDRKQLSGYKAFIEHN